ncbi:MAG: hypothetical protein HDP34_00615 [Clostridia bacterium]|nr:hypothetical protein [Clostridia bacterium]
MFEEMIDRVQTTTISRLLKGRIVRVQNNRPVPVQRMGAPQEVSPVNPDVAARAREIMEQRIKELEEAAKKQQQETAAQTPPAAATPSAGAPVIGDAPQPPKDLMANIGGKQQPRVAPKSAKVGRNDPCPCGSGKKYKDCCYWKDNK